MNWYLTVLKKYAQFDGRAGLREFWMFVLINFLIVIALMLIDFAVGLFGILSIIYALGIIIPSIAVSVRRLHDTGKSGWNILLGLIPAIGFIILLFFYLQAGQNGENTYGPEPKKEPEPEVQLT